MRAKQLFSCCLKNPLYEAKLFNQGIRSFMNVGKSIILIIFQILLFIAIHDGTLKLYEQFSDTSKIDISWGLSVTIAVWLFAFISIVATLLSELLFKDGKFTFLLIGFLIFGAFQIQQITFRPYRTFLLLVSAFISLVIPYLVTAKSLKNDYF
jgi:hypothetical protein